MRKFFEFVCVCVCGCGWVGVFYYHTMISTYQLITTQVQSKHNRTESIEIVKHVQHTLDERLRTFELRDTR